MNGMAVDSGVVVSRRFYYDRSTEYRNRNFEARYPVVVGVEAAPSGKPRLLDPLRQALRARHYSPKTETVYVIWVGISGSGYHSVISAEENAKCLYIRMFLDFRVFLSSGFIPTKIVGFGVYTDPYKHCYRRPNNCA